jgi:hypothetical protein
MCTEIFSQSPLSHDVLQRIAAPLEKMRALLVVPGERERTLLRQQPALDFAAFLSAAQDRVGESRFRELVAPITRIGWSDLVVPGMDRYLQPSVESFEHVMMVIGNGVRKEAEVWYKPMLQVALLLTPKRNGQYRVTVPDELGLLLTQCSQASSPGAPLAPLVDPHIVIIRNSDAHEQTQIDPVAETITFVKRPRTQPVERLGPLSRQELGLIVRKFTDRCLTMSLVYRAVAG